MNLKVKIGFGGSNCVTVNTSVSHVNSVFDEHDAKIINRLVNSLIFEGLGCNIAETEVNGVSYSLVLKDV